MRDLERFIVLQVVDIRWREHLENMDYMREGIHLRGMAQKDPLVEYRHEGHGMFLELNRLIREEVVTLLFHAQVEADRRAARRRRRRPASTGPGPNGGGPNGRLSYEHQSLAGADAIAAGGRRPRRLRSRGRRLGRDAAGGQVRAREHRPQRPVLVRVGQEVQALPRRLRASAPTVRAWRRDQLD